MLSGVRWHLVLLKVSDVKHFFQAPVVIFYVCFLLANAFPGILLIFKCVLEDFQSVLQFPNKVCISDPCQIYELPVFSPFSRLSLHSAFLYCAENLVKCYPILIFAFAFMVLSKISCQFQCLKAFFYFSSSSFIILGHTFSPLIYSKLVFCN